MILRTKLRCLTLAAFAALHAAGGCNFAFDLKDELMRPCKTSADCERADVVCQRGQCVARTTADLSCSASADCSSFGEFYACRSARCVNLQTPECNDIYGDFRNNDAIFFSAILPTSGDGASVGIPRLNSFKLALDDFDKVSKGLPPAAGSTAPRPMVLIACDQNADGIEAATTTATRVAQRLASEVRIAALFMSFSGIIIEVANTVTIPQQVLLFAPTSTSTAISDLDDNDLVWRTTPPDTLQAQTLALYMPEVEAKVRAELHMQQTDKVKVAIANKGDAYGTGLSRAMEQTFFVNGLRATDRNNADNYRGLDYGNPQDPEAFPTKYDEVVQEILKFKPHVLFLFGTVEAVTEVFAPVEERWQGDGPPVAYRPMVVFSHGGRVPELWQYIAAHDPDDSLRRRVSGTIPGAENDIYNLFRAAYRTKYGEFPQVFGTAGAYDIIYLLAYSTAGISDPSVTGPLLAKRLRELKSGREIRKVNVGPGEINATFSWISKGGGIDLSGASGPLDFDAKGDAPSDIQLWCIPKDSMGKATEAIYSGRFYNSESRALEGEFEGCN